MLTGALGGFPGPVACVSECTAGPEPEHPGVGLLGIRRGPSIRPEATVAGGTTS